ncbi:MAG: branched-chain amino acid ABC transporter permease [Stellaceae bacterium]
MDSTILLALIQDGLVNGAIYALLGIALVLVFLVTRVILIPQGEFVAFAALTLDQLQRGDRPGTAGLLVALGVAAFVIDSARLRRRITRAWLLRHIASDLILPGVVFALVAMVASHKPGPALASLLTCLLVAPAGPYIYRLAFQPLQQASSLVLLIAAMGVHLALSVMGLVFFGPEGFESPSFSDASFTLRNVEISGQDVIMIGVSLVIMLVLWLFFERTLYGKALRAVAVNRTGAQLVGVPIAMAGEIAFALAGLIGAVSGILIAPVTMVYYDSGFLIGLKGFVAALIGGIASYPLVVAGAFAVGIVQSFAAFWNSAFTEVIVFMILIPVLLLRSLRAPTVDEEEE